MEKSKVTNLNKAESEFLGFSIRLHKKGKRKWLSRTFVAKQKKTLKNKLKQQIKKFNTLEQKKKK
jgi:hypothetical protein